MQNQAT